MAFFLDAGKREISAGGGPRPGFQLLSRVQAHVIQLERVGFDGQIGVDGGQLGLQPVEGVFGGIQLLLQCQQRRLQLLHFVR